MAVVDRRFDLEGTLSRQIVVGLADLIWCTWLLVYLKSWRASSLGKMQGSQTAWTLA